MDILPRDTRRMYNIHPKDQRISQVFEDPVRDCQQPISPYWLDQPAQQQLNIGNSFGKVVNDNDKFGVSVNVAQFQPEELSVNITNNKIVVEGHHEERDDKTGQIERHFVRKYAIPDDVNAETVESHLSDEGVLSVCAKKLSIENKNTRSILIQAAPHEKQASNEQKKATPG